MSYEITSMGKRLHAAPTQRLAERYRYPSFLPGGEAVRELHGDGQTPNRTGVKAIREDLRAKFGEQSEMIGEMKAINRVREALAERLEAQPELSTEIGTFLTQEYWDIYNAKEAVDAEIKILKQEADRLRY